MYGDGEGRATLFWTSLCIIWFRLVAMQRSRMAEVCDVWFYCHQCGLLPAVDKLILFGNLSDTTRFASRRYGTVDLVDKVVIVGLHALNISWTFKMRQSAAPAADNYVSTPRGLVDLRIDDARHGLHCSAHHADSRERSRLTTLPALEQAFFGGAALARLQKKTNTNSVRLMLLHLEVDVAINHESDTGHMHARQCNGYIPNHHGGGMVSGELCRYHQSAERQ